MRPDGKRQEILSEATVDGHLSVRTWHHLAVNVKDSVQKKKVVIEVRNIKKVKNYTFFTFDRGQTTLFLLCGA